MSFLDKSVKDHVMTLTMSSPETRNALTSDEQFGEFEKVVALSHFIHFTKDLGPLAIYFFFFGNELLLAHTVVAVVISFVDLAHVIELLKDLPNYSLMAILCGANVVIVGNIKRAAETLKFCSEAIADFNWRHTCCLG